jgi:hypothetical protein
MKRRGTIYGLAAAAAIVAVVAVAGITQLGGESTTGNGVDRDEENAKVEAVANANCRYQGQTDDGSLYECGSYSSPRRYVVNGDGVTPAN